MSECQDTLAIGAAQAPMASTSIRQTRTWRQLCAVVGIAAGLQLLGSVPAHCADGGFGSPAPAPGQCDVLGPRVNCGACLHSFYNWALPLQSQGRAPVLVRGTTYTHVEHRGCTAWLYAVLPQTCTASKVYC